MPQDIFFLTTEPSVMSSFDPALELDTFDT